MAEEQITQPQLAFRYFSQRCRATQTRKGYTAALYYFMDYLGLAHDQYDRLLDKDPKTIQMDICQYILYLREKGLSSATINMYG